MNVICYGDSNTYGYDPRSYFGDRYPAASRWVDILAKKTGWKIVNEGMNGREVPQGPVLVPANADLFIIMLGTNDLLQEKDASAVADRMEAFLSTMQAEKGKLLLIAPPPMKLGEWVSDPSLIDASILLAHYYRKLSARLGFRFVDAGNWNVNLSFDGVHFTEVGHCAFAEGLLMELGSINT